LPSDEAKPNRKEIFVHLAEAKLKMVADFTQGDCVVMLPGFQIDHPGHR
jgi:hypothetical protein